MYSTLTFLDKPEISASVPNYIDFELAVQVKHACACSNATDSCMNGYQAKLSKDNKLGYSTTSRYSIWAELSNVTLLDVYLGLFYFHPVLFRLYVHAHGYL